MDGNLEFWDVAAGKRRGEIAHLGKWEFASFDFSPDSGYFWLNKSEPDALTMWDVSSASLLWSRTMPVFPGFHYGVGFNQGIENICIHVIECRTGNTAHVLPHDSSFDSPRMLRFMTISTKGNQQPSIFKRLLGDWWPGKTNTTVQEVRVVEVASGRELGRLEGETLEESWLSKDGHILVTKHLEDGEYLLRVWDLPLRPPLLLVAGIPLALGVIVLLFSRWRARRRLRAEAAKPTTAPALTTGS